MNLAFSSLACPDYTIEEVVQAAVTFGFDAVSIRTIEGTVDLPTLPPFKPTQIAKTKALFDDAGIKVLCFSSGLRFISRDNEELQEQLQNGREYVDLAAAFSAPYIRIFGGYIPREESPESCMSRIATWMDRLADYAEQKAVRVLLETHDDFSTGQRIDQLFSKLKSGNVGVIWDILHSIRHGEAYQDTWDILKSKIYNVHIKDAIRYSPKSTELTICGKGKLPIPEIVKLLYTAGYSGYYEFEWEKGWHPELPDAEVALPAYVEYMKGVEGNIT